MKKLTLFAPLLLAGCGGLAVMDRTDAVKAQPEMLIKTDGDFWGFGADGHFDFAITLSDFNHFNAQPLTEQIVVHHVFDYIICERIFFVVHFIFL